VFDSPKKLFNPQFIRSAATHLEGLWFDATRRVQTSDYVPLDRLTLRGSRKSGFDYLPSRPSVARQIFAALPIQDYREYTFVDFGSGKGRMLFLAAEHPYRKVQGVEFAVELHEQAEKNISRYRHATKRCSNIESINVDACEYPLPAGNLVLYFFNPFGPEIFTKVLANLGDSLARHPRKIFAAVLNPEFAYVLDATPFLRLYLQTRRFRIYQSRIAAE
jgi:SAM-dependent methyltransferase